MPNTTIISTSNSSFSFAIVARRQGYVIKFWLYGRYHCSDIAFLFMLTLSNYSSQVSLTILVISYGSIMGEGISFSISFMILFTLTDVILSNVFCSGESPTCKSDVPYRIPITTHHSCDGSIYLRKGSLNRIS